MTRSRRSRLAVRTLLVGVLVSAVCAPAHARDQALPGIASAFIPGAGQLMNGDTEAAAVHFGVFAVSVYGAIRYHGQDDFLHTDQRFDQDNNRELINRTTLKYDYALRLASDMPLECSRARSGKARRELA